MKSKNNSKSIIGISLLTIFIVLSDIIYSLNSIDFPDFYTQEDKNYEYEAIFFRLLILIPAILGFFISKRNNSDFVKWGFVIYLILIILSYIAIFLATDPISAGFLYVFFGMPYSFMLSAYLLSSLFKKK